MAEIKKQTIFTARAGITFAVAAIVGAVFVLFQQHLAGAGWDLARIGLAFALMVVLVRFNWPIGPVLMLSAVYMAVLFACSPGMLARLCTFGVPWPEEAALHDFGVKGVALALTIIFINLLGQLLSEGGGFRRLVEAFEHLMGDMRAVAPVVPSLGGLLPMPAGALISAPVVDEIGDRMGISADEKTAINYWFRHEWELFWPLYPALIFIAKEYMPLRKLIVFQFPLTIMAVLAGSFFLLRPLKTKPRIASTFTGSKARQVGAIFRVLSPILFVLLAWLIGEQLLRGRIKDFMLPGVLLTVDAVLAYVLVRMGALKQPAVWTCVRKAAKADTVVLVAGVYMLMAAFQVAHAADRLPSAMQMAGIPVALVCFTVPMLVGLVTGYTIGAIATTFAMLAPFFKTTPALIPLAYTGGYLGVLLSPVHLCIVLTCQYFHTEMAPVYRRFLPCTVPVILLAWLIYWFASTYPHLVP